MKTAQTGSCCHVEMLCFTCAAANSLRQTLQGSSCFRTLSGSYRSLVPPPDTPPDRTQVWSILTAVLPEPTASHAAP